MRRKYLYIPTPEVAARSEAVAARLHDENEARRVAVDEEFAAAAKQQPRIEARRRDLKRREKLRKETGTARKAAKTPATVAGKRAVAPQSDSKQGGSGDGLCGEQLTWE